MHTPQDTKAADKNEGRMCCPEAGAGRQGGAPRVREKSAGWLNAQGGRSGDGKCRRPIALDEYQEAEKAARPRLPALRTSDMRRRASSSPTEVLSVSAKQDIGTMGGRL